MNKTERLLYQKHTLSDEERAQVLKLLNCGLPANEIADIMHISKTTVAYIRQAHTACLAQDWSTLQRLSKDCRLTTEWALRITGTDKVFKETFGEPKTEKEPEQIAPAVETITKEDFYAAYATLQDIRSLLVEIRDILK